MGYRSPVLRSPWTLRAEPCWISCSGPAEIINSAGSSNRATIYNFAPCHERSFGISVGLLIAIPDTDYSKNGNSRYFLALQFDGKLLSHSTRAQIERANPRSVPRFRSAPGATTTNENRTCGLPSCACCATEPAAARSHARRCALTPPAQLARAAATRARARTCAPRTHSATRVRSSFAFADCPSAGVNNTSPLRWSPSNISSHL
jgi:hypothetical protein